MIKHLFTTLCALALITAGSIPALAAEADTSESARYYPISVEEYRTLADNLSTSQTYTLAASPAALGLAANERVTEIMFVFGQAPAGFAQVETPYLNCTAVANLPANSSFVNIADVGGVYNGTWVQAISRWVTTVYGKPTPLPRTGY